MTSSTGSNPFSSLHKKMQLGPGTSLWVWPETADAPELAETSDLARVGLDEANAAVLFVGSAKDVASLMASRRDVLAGCRVVWMVYAKGNKASVNRDKLWTQLLEYSWRAVSNVSFSERLSAIRIRPLKPGEDVRQV